MVNYLVVYQIAEPNGLTIGNVTIDMDDVVHGDTGINYIRSVIAINHSNGAYKPHRLMRKDEVLLLNLIKLGV